MSVFVKKESPLKLRTVTKPWCAKGAAKRSWEMAHSWGKDKKGQSQLFPGWYDAICLRYSFRAYPICKNCLALSSGDETNTLAYSLCWGGWFGWVLRSIRHQNIHLGRRFWTFCRYKILHKNWEFRFWKGWRSVHLEKNTLRIQSHSFLCNRNKLST